MIYRIDLTEEEYDLLQKIFISAKGDLPRHDSSRRVLEGLQIKVGLTLPEKKEKLSKRELTAV